MITLNSERGLQRIESWDDILSTPGFTTHVDLRTVKLKEIIGSYREALAAATEVTGLDRRNRISGFVEVQVGQLDGFAAIAAGNGLKEIVGSIEPFVATLAEANIDTLSDKQLRELPKIGGELEPNLARLRVVAAAGRRLLVRQNIQQLAQFLMMREDIRAFGLFVRDLPPQEV
ncbi:MAG: hypothetical protein KA144_08900 [Xanthomonadaceae bacterium]|nr:hypothetical protein [Xanthomonadaceae bacterium]